MLMPGVVDKNVDGADFALDARHVLGNRLLVRDIKGISSGCQAAFLHLGNCCCNSFGIPPVDHPRAVLAQPLCDRKSQPAVRA